jgi:cytochrome c5
MTRDIKAPNTMVMKVARELGVGEKRGGAWWFTSQELDAIQLERQKQKDKKAEELARHKADKAARRQARIEAEMKERLARMVIRHEGAYQSSRQKCHGSDERASTSRSTDEDWKQRAARMSGHDWIDDKNLFRAVQFSRTMIRDGTPAQLAHWRAAKYWGVSQHDVAKYVGQIGSRIKQDRRDRKRRRWEAS